MMNRGSLFKKIVNRPQFYHHKQYIHTNPRPNILYNQNNNNISHKNNNLFQPNNHKSSLIYARNPNPIYYTTYRHFGSPMTTRQRRLAVIRDFLFRYATRPTMVIFHIFPSIHLTFAKEACIESVITHKAPLTRMIKLKDRKRVIVVFKPRLCTQLGNKLPAQMHFRQYMRSLSRIKFNKNIAQLYYKSITKLPPTVRKWHSRIISIRTMRRYFRRSLLFLVIFFGYLSGQQIGHFALSLKQSAQNEQETTEQLETNEHQPQHVSSGGDQPQHVSNQPQQIAYQPQLVSNQPQQIAYQPQQIAYQPQHVSNQPQQIAYQPQHVSNQPQQIAYQPQQIAYQPQQIAYQPQQIEYQPQNVTNNGYQQQQLIPNNSDQPQIVNSNEYQQHIIPNNVYQLHNTGYQPQNITNNENQQQNFILTPQKE